jgi:hypothetical protein
MRGAGNEKLSLDQAPPLAIPLSFFALAPLALLGAGALLVILGAAPLAAWWSPSAVALTHLLTLGFLGSVMLGALYQMLPVVASAPVRGVYAAYAVLAAWALGISAFAWGMVRGDSVALGVALGALGGALALFALPAGVALAASGARTDTVRGMKGAFTSLLAVAGLGLTLLAAMLWADIDIPRALVRRIHLAFGVLGWVGGLIAAVSWQILPMFYLAPEPPAASRRLVGATLGIGLAITAFAWAPVALAGPGLAGAADGIATLGTAIALLACWGLHPLVALRAIAKRRRRRADPSLDFWRAALVTAGLLLAAAPFTLVSDDPRALAALGYVALVGWAGAIVHGMLSRIVPFLVWFHWYSPLVGIQDVPSMKALVPEPGVKVGLVFHGAAVAAGLVAIATGWDWAARLAGLGLAAIGGSIAHMLWVATRRRA